jgi:hypothetical protein
MQDNANLSKNIAKSSAKWLFGDNENIYNQYLTDVKVRYLAPETVYLFQNFSNLLNDLLISIVGSYIFYRTFQQHEDKKQREELYRKVENILENQIVEFNRHLKKIEEKIDKFDKLDESTIKGTVDKENIPEKKARKEYLIRRKKRFKIYRNIGKKLRPPKKATRRLIKIIEKEYEKHTNIEE